MVIKYLDAAAAADMSPGGGLKGDRLLILSSFPVPAGAIKRLESEFPGLEVVVRADVDPWSGKPPPEDIDWSKVTVLLTGMMLPTKEQAPNLKLVQLQSAGANYILDNPLFTDTKITFCSANGIHGPQIAEWVICTFLSFQHHIPHYLSKMKDGEWDKGWDGKIVQDCSGARIGVLGYGSIGRQVARIAKAMGMDVYAYTNRPRDTPESRRDEGFIVPGLGDPDGDIPSKWFSGSDPSSIHAFLTSGLDLLVLAVPLTPATQHMIGEEQLKSLSGNKTFVSNISRGPVVDTDALMKALDEGWIRGAALDVTDPEPLPKDHPLWHKKNLLITPHISGLSSNLFGRVFQLLQLNLENLAEGKEFLNKVSRKRGY